MEDKHEIAGIFLIGLGENLTWNSREMLSIREENTVLDVPIAWLIIRPLSNIRVKTECEPRVWGIHCSTDRLCSLPTFSLISSHLWFLKRASVIYESSNQFQPYMGAQERSINLQVLLLASDVINRKIYLLSPALKPLTSFKLNHLLSNKLMIICMNLYVWI